MKQYQLINHQTKQKLQVSFKQMADISPDQASDKLTDWLDKLPKHTDADYCGDIVLPDRRFLGSLSEYLYSSYIKNTDMDSLMKANKSLICRRDNISSDHPVVLETIEKADPIIHGLISLNTVPSLMAAGDVLHTQLNALSYYNGPGARKPIKKSLLSRIENVANTLVAINTTESVKGALDVLEKDIHDEKAYQPAFNALVTFDTKESRKLAYDILWSRTIGFSGSAKELTLLNKQMKNLAEKPIESTNEDVQLFVNNFNIEKYKEKYAAKSAHNTNTVL
jgi:hypothetical protein